MALSRAAAASALSEATAGSTCLEVARALDARRVTVVTHDLLVGLEILKKPSLNLVFVGGELQQKVRSIASTAYFVADSTKFGRNALYKVLGIDAFTAGITDSFLSPISAAAYPIPLIRAEVAQG